MIFFLNKWIILLNRCFVLRKYLISKTLHATIMFYLNFPKYKFYSYYFFEPREDFGWELFSESCVEKLLLVYYVFILVYFNSDLIE